MYGRHIFILILASIGVTIALNCPDVRVSEYSKKSGTKWRLTSIRSGNYTIQGLLTLATSESDCSVVSRDGLVRSYAVKYAIDKANKDESMTRWATLGLQLDDICRSLPMTMARAIEIISFHRPNSVCRMNFLKCDGDVKRADVKKAIAVIGTQTSFTTIPLASLMSMYYIPQVSYAASSKKKLFKSFFRTIPSVKSQILAMLDIFARFNWTYVFAIGSDDDYGKPAVSDLKREASNRNVCISHDEYILYQSQKTKQSVVDVVKKIKATPKAKVVVLFCYVNGLGNYILEEAAKQGVDRVWLTSEAWNPDAARLSMNLQNQVKGILTVSLKTYKLKHLVEYMEEQIKNDWACNMWLKNYLKNSEFRCEPIGISADKTMLTGNNCNVSISHVVDTLSVMPGKIDSLIDSVTAVTVAVKRLLQKLCSDNNTTCNNLEFTDKEMRQLTAEMFNVSFVNDQNLTVSFNDAGDPKFSFYTIENLQVVNGSYVFVPVGNWSELEELGSRLKLDLAKIKWPHWFENNLDKKHPISRCSEKCVPGEAVFGRVDCCWGCIKCQKNNYTSTYMETACRSCGKYHYTDPKNTRCILKPILWLEMSKPAGMSIIIISLLGMIVMIMACIILFKYRHLLTPNDPAPHLINFACVLLILTFVYGPLHITEPTNELCQTQESIFFLLLMMYSAISLIKSKYMISYLQKHAERSFNGNLLLAQLTFLAILFLIELLSVIVWLYIDNVQVEEVQHVDVHEIWKKCEVSFTVARLLSTLIPCIVLIIATFGAFRERNQEHSFYEPKFLIFCCIASCITMVAHLPTFIFVVGIYKTLVMPFTLDVLSFNFMVCLVYPKIYVAVMRHRREICEYPMKPGTARRKKEEKKVVRTKSTPTSSNQRTESSIIDESTVTKDQSMYEPNDDLIRTDQPDYMAMDCAKVKENADDTIKSAEEIGLEDVDYILQGEKPPPYDDLRYKGIKM
ncbi:extracellular calcium-sensing receptor-like [Hydractinia symbiolongicarpus]|uniref:extracellular calcium-sensing receptor-like n=1 Tax=Hydractinia symbiolongicarpus TaxID=13093 RepID=UPI00254B1F30|nr:extracellular calcium-sensing receptor-like [Hydractinia symbiolongicarpus]